jgi:sulfoxide reductase catalytic subunit YedY
MLIRRPSDIPSSEITPESVYRNRREFMRGAIGLTALGIGGAAFAKPGNIADAEVAGPDWLKTQIASASPGKADKAEDLTPYQHVTGYNNFYEFGYDKTDPADKSGLLKVDPWQVEIAGAWSMVIPWIGFSLADLLKRFEPTSKAKYVAFTTLQRPEEMPGQKARLSTIQWPYREGLRLDEAMHPLTLLAVGLYGKILPNQNGAPLRLVVPWKYGFKSIKSIVKIELTETQPYTSWSAIAAEEYGFYANVNPKVDHPRWSQAQERRLPSGLLRPNIIPTEMFNGYADQVASLYNGMDLRTFY